MNKQQGTESLAVQFAERLRYYTKHPEELRRLAAELEKLEA